MLLKLGAHGPCMVSMNFITFIMILGPNIQEWHGFPPSQRPRKMALSVLLLYLPFLHCSGMRAKVF